MSRVYIDRDWKFSSEFQEAYIHQMMQDGMDVTIPHTVAETPFHYFDESTYQMISCYQRQMVIPAQWKGQTIFLVFEGVGHQADVYVNGEHVKHHCNGYTRFSIDISEVVRYGGENLVTVKVNSREDINQPPFGFVIDYMTYGGIYRDVYLEVKSPVYMWDVFYQPSLMTPPRTRGMKAVDIANYTVLGQLVTEMRLSETAQKLMKEHRLMIRQTLDDKQISKQPLENGGYSKTVAGDVYLWDIESPRLYHVVTELLVDGRVCDRHEADIGFREFSFKKEGFYLNGRRVKLRGLNRHQSYPYVGYAMPEQMQREDARICKKELGLNAVRTSHYPQSHYFLDECDRLGLLVFTEIPGWQHIGDQEWKDIAVENTREMVVEYRNHTSIMLWGVRINESGDDDDFYVRTNKVAHEMDTTRPTGGVRCNKKMSFLEDVYTYNDFSHNGPNAGCEPKKKVTPDVERPYFISEYNGHMYPTKSFDWEEHRMEQTLRHARVLDAVAGEAEIAGAFGWCMFDYNTHKDFGSGDRICYHGVMDMFRNPKMAAAIYAAQADEEPVLEITSSMDIGEHPASVRGETYIITNADSVRMYKNDALVKEYTPEMSSFSNLAHGPILIDDFVGEDMQLMEGFSNRQTRLIKTCLNTVSIHGYKATPKIFWAALQLMVFYRMNMKDATRLFQQYVGDWGGVSKVYRFEAIKDGKVVKTVVKNPMTTPHMEVKVSHTTLVEDQTYDVASIRMKACDEYGNVLPYFQEAIRVEASGMVGVIGPRTIPFRGGMAGLYVKTLGALGEGKIKLSAEGMEPVEISFSVEKKENS
ncbi:MAG: glycoside hydrolase family 2 protein [Lachnospiraceae bacterium]|nr:glycoside hydrolase family 2 protein [Lachnospiraceae bacterium]